MHSAALTDVDGCEREKELAYRMNVEGTRAIAEAAERAGSFLFTYLRIMSSMESEACTEEDDIPNPVSYYGYSKLLGEQFCSGCIARTCVIYGSRPASSKVNFALWLLNSLRLESRFAWSQISSSRPLSTPIWPEWSWRRQTGGYPECTISPEPPGYLGMTTLLSWPGHLILNRIWLQPSRMGDLKWVPEGRRIHLSIHPRP